MASRRGHSGDDVLSGTSRSDVLSGLNGNDRLYGGDGADRMVGGAGNDFLSGGKGTDFLRGDAGADRLYGGANHDVLYGGLAADSLRGGDGNDELFGQAGGDRLFGERGNDLLVGGAGRDQLHGGAGADRLVYDAADTLIHGDAGRDTLVINGRGVTLDLNLAGTPQVSGIEVIDLNGTGGNTLRIDAADVLAMNDSHSLMIMGGADDSVISSTDIWSQNFAGAVDIDGQHYLAWDSGAAHLLVDSDISLNNLAQNGTTFTEAQGAMFRPVPEEFPSSGGLETTAGDLGLDTDLHLRGVPPV